MKPASAVAFLVLSLSSLRLSASDNPQVDSASGNPQVDSVYEQIHGRVCTELQVRPCPPSLDRDETWAFVATWCARHQTEEICKGIPPSGGPVVIAFDHDGRAWRPISGVDPRDIDIDANGAPRILTGNGRKLIAVVESTNPLAYKAEAGVITETNAAVVDNVKKLFEKLGPVLAGLAGQAGGDELRESDRAAITVTKDAAARIECIPDHWLAARDFTQHVEDREQAEYRVLKQACPASGSLGDAFKTLADAATVLSKIDFCVGEASAISDWVNLPPTDVKALRAKQKEIVVTISCEPRLGEIKTGADLRLDRLEEAAKLVAAHPTGPNVEKLAARQAEWRTGSDLDRKAVDRLRTTAAEAAAAVTAAADLQKPEARKKIDTILASLKRFEQRLLASTATSATLAGGVFHTGDVADFFVVPHGPITVSWTKVRSRTLTVTKASPFDTLSTNRPDSVASSYSAASLSASLIDMNVALTHTPLFSPVFGAVSVPAPTAADPNGKKLVIAKTDEDSRSGELAVLVSYPVLHHFFDGAWARSLGVEFGAGTTTANRALFLGASLRLNSAVRLGVGVTQQLVKDLDGQHTDDPVSAATDIKLEDERERSWYASISLSLESIGDLFKAD
jgi:hypothetical protein